MPISGFDIAIRRIQMESTGLKRTVKKIKTSLGEAQVKVCELESGMRIYPEYASVVELCEKHQIAYQDAYHIIKKECEAAEGIRGSKIVGLNRFELPLSSCLSNEKYIITKGNIKEQSNFRTNGIKVSEIGIIMLC